MLYLNLLVIVCLVGFFGFGANINDVNSMMAPIILPAILLFEHTAQRMRLLHFV
ncbi:MAG: hypothetical protein L6V85_07110 [Clostridiales bacterium]|nr:MAG: hypothetical protein L6V85_07110 [Clostridiales bacterium]